jgi:hypothetical protein
MNRPERGSTANNGLFHFAGYLDIFSVFFYLYCWGAYQNNHFYHQNDTGHTVYALLVPGCAALVALAGVMCLRTRAWWLSFTASLAGVTVLAYQIFITHYDVHHWFDESITRTLVISSNPGLYGGLVLGIGAIASMIVAKTEWKKWKRWLILVMAFVILALSATVSILVGFQQTVAIE